jgi:putative flippase GtrA
MKTQKLTKRLADPLREFFLYALTGVSAALVYGFALWGATLVLAQGIYAIVLAQSFALTFHLVVNARVTFRGVSITRPLLVRYLIFQICTNLTLFFISSLFLSTHGLHPLIVGIVSTAIVGVFGFFVARLWVFRP